MTGPFLLLPPFSPFFLFFSFPYACFPVTISRRNCSGFFLFFFYPTRMQASQLQLAIPDQPFRHFRASRSGDELIFCSSKTSCNGFWSSNIVKGSVGLLLLQIYPGPVLIDSGKQASKKRRKRKKMRFQKKRERKRAVVSFSTRLAIGDTLPTRPNISPFQNLKNSSTHRFYAVHIHRLTDFKAL